MGAVWLWVRAEMRRRWRAWVSLALITGIAAGVAIAAAAGARRTATAYPRFARAQDGFHALTGGGAEHDYARRYEAIKRLPQVAAWSEIVIVGGHLRVPARRGRPEEILSFPQALLTTDIAGRFLYETNRAKVLEGRLANRADPSEVMVPFTIAARLDIRVGDRLIGGIGFDFEAFPPQPVKEVSLKVVGITAAPGDFDAVGLPADFRYIAVSPALYERFRDIIPPLNPDTYNLAVHLKEGPAASHEFKRLIESVYDLDVPLVEPVITGGVQRTIKLYAAALWLVAGLVGVAGIAILGQTVARQIFLGSVDHPSLRAIGFGRGHLMLAALMQAGAVALMAMPVAVLIAFLASPLSPIGPARVAEPSPGFDFDAATIGIGAAAVMASVLLVAAWPAWRAARVSRGFPERDRTSRVVTTATRSSASPAAVAGLRMALEPGRGRAAVPVRSTVLAVSIGIAAIAATATVGGSLHHLIGTPALAGFTYDAISPNDGELSDDQVRRKLLDLPFVEATTDGTGLNVNFAGTDSFILGLKERDAIGFAVISGRAPSDGSADGLPETALGPTTARRIGAAIGDVVQFSFPYHEPDSDDDERRVQRARVVGTAAVPPLPWMGVDAGEGAVMTLGGIARFNPETGGCCFVRFRPGTDLEDARDAMLEQELEVYIRTKRADLQNLERLTSLPGMLTAIFGAMAVAALAHVLVTAIRRRRRDLAIFKTLGFVDRQIRGAVAWQASTIAALCLALGIPAGVVLGRWGWRLVAAQFGVVPVTIPPWIALGVAFPAALVVANLVAAIPARAATRTSAAAVLRAE